jgi:hypothetical protein
MKAPATWVAACLALLGGCAQPQRLQEARGAAQVGAPNMTVDPGVMGGSSDKEDRPSIRLPERIALPASYRLVLLDGHLVLVRETDPQALEPAPTSMRVVVGEVARNGFTTPGSLLPQELAAAVLSSRETSSRMESALEAVMRRSRELSEQALELQAQSRKLGELLVTEQARVRQLEAAGRPAQEQAAPTNAEPATPPE